MSLRKINLTRDQVNRMFVDKNPNMIEDLSVCGLVWLGPYL